jgi:hypothetical protein
MSNSSQCPLCGGTNNCGVAQGQSACWCFSTSIPPEVLAQVPEDERNVACVCQRCAESAVDRPKDPASR